MSWDAMWTQHKQLIVDFEKLEVKIGEHISLPESGPSSWTKI